MEKVIGGDRTNIRRGLCSGSLESYSKSLLRMVRGFPQKSGIKRRISKTEENFLVFYKVLKVFQF